MGAIDADAHVIETMQTWSYLEGDERRFTPQLMRQTSGEELLSNEGIAVPDFWVIEGRAHGKDRNVGTNTPQESREMLSVEARLAHMDELGIETQVLYPTLFLRPVVQEAERERALCKSYNRWMADLWRQGKGRLRWVAKPPLRLLEKAPAVVRHELEWAKNNGACGIFMRGLECERASAPHIFTHSGRYPVILIYRSASIPPTVVLFIMSFSMRTRPLQSLSSPSSARFIPFSKKRSRQSSRRSVGASLR
jgi:predicted TIM-barrel fold metal-dependent hydrolase